MLLVRNVSCYDHHHTQNLSLKGGAFETEGIVFTYPIILTIITIYPKFKWPTHKTRIDRPDLAKLGAKVIVILTFLFRFPIANFKNLDKKKATWVIRRHQR